MHQQVSRKTAMIVIVAAVVLLLAVGWYVLYGPRRLSYPAGFNPASPPTATPGDSAGR